MPDRDTFYATLPHQSDFDALTSFDGYTPLPDDWFIGVADIVDSTAHIEAGRYKTVNTVGAAVISAQINALAARTATDDEAAEPPTNAFPFVFGGDGASFAMPAMHQASATDALARLRRWALEEFGFQLRTAIVPLSHIRKHGYDVRVARYDASPGSDYAMFAGGGVRFAEDEMKADRFLIDMAPEGAFPNLTGLSCRWMPMQAAAGDIVSLVVQPANGADREPMRKILRAIVAETAKLERGGHPVPVEGPGFQWVPEGLELEARATHGRAPLWKRKAQLWFETLIALVFFKTGWAVGGFDAVHYTRTTGNNADFRKIEDGLKLTIACPQKTRARIEAICEKGRKAGHIRYGMAVQDAAVMTCIVPSVMRDDHVHFVDGASGGYALAARRLKESAA